MPTDRSREFVSWGVRGWDSFHQHSSRSCQASNLCSLGSLFVMVSRKSILPTNVVTFNFFFFQNFPRCTLTLPVSVEGSNAAWGT